MEVKIVKDKISEEELKKIGSEFFNDMVKVVVDLKKEIMAVGGELHADASAVLIENGSIPEDIWGINIRFDKPKQEWIEYESLLNIRPALGNRSMIIEIPEIKGQIKKIVDNLT